MNTLNFIPLIVCGLLLIQCKSKKEEIPEIADLKFEFPSDRVLVFGYSTEYPKAISIYGEWTYQSDNVWYSAGLIINKNGLFKYFDQSCLGKDSTEGNWVDNGLNQVFTSFENYKESPVLFSETVVSKPEISRKSTKRKSNKQIRFIPDTSLFNTTVNIKGVGNHNTYFDKKLFRFIDGFLFELDQNGFPTGAKYFQTKSFN